MGLLDKDFIKTVSVICFITVIGFDSFVFGELKLTFETLR